MLHSLTGIRKRSLLWASLGIGAMFLLPEMALGAEISGEDLGSKLPLWSVIPFVGILLSIALMPLLAPQVWHHHFGKVAAGGAVLLAAPFWLVYREAAFHELAHIILIDYVPFIIVLWGLFTIGGGIVLKGSLVGRPATNVALLLIGTIMASWVGTTGAAMLLIRPLIRANAWRHHKQHIIIFFIFLVANIGGSLTPLGDPPLLLGFIHGVPFFWTMALLPAMLVAVALILAIFYLVDVYYMKKEAHPPPEHSGPQEPMHIEGAHNFIFLLGVLLLVLFSGSVQMSEITVLGIHLAWQDIIRNFGIVVMGWLSLKTTSRALRTANDFSWAPILEVAYLFAGIFITIIPALVMLRAGSEGAMAFITELVEEPWQYFWVTGILSSFLDNAPTYLTFFNTALGKLRLTEEEVSAFLTTGETLAVAGPAALATFEQLLYAISMGAVFMGAVTYIGNAPNFMVRAIAEENGIEMPSFFGFMFWSVIILMPIFVIITFIFLR